jgi:serine/threonine protein kinase/TPR repeat protein
MDDDLELGATLKGFSPGQKLSDRYALERILGKGGMGVVWLVRDEELKREIAMKFLPEIVVRDREATADLKRETRRSLELTHQNIVRIYDFVQGPNWAGITMEHIDGETLSALKVDEPGGCFDVDKIAPWIEQLCRALSHAHEEARVVHRDLKPSNLMLTKAGKIKVADFGISGTLTESMSRVSVRPTTSGTLVYMSPQQAMGEPPAVTDDVYSIGATIYDLLTGKPPFYTGDVVRQLREKEPTSMQERRSRLQITGKQPIPENWEKAVAACLKKDAAQRPQSITEFALMVYGSAYKVEKRNAPLPKKPEPAKPQEKTPAAATATPPQPASSSKAILAIAAVLVLAGIIAVAMHFMGGKKETTTSTGGGTAATPAPSAAPAASVAPQPVIAAATPTPVPVTASSPHDIEQLDPTKVQQLAANGNAAAQGLLSFWYAIGYKTPQNYKLAFTYGSMASASGDPVGTFSLAWLYWTGAGVTWNTSTAQATAAKATLLLAQAPAQGEAAANVCLAMAYGQGLGMTKDENKAFSLLQDGANAGYGPAQAGLAYMYAVGAAGVVSRDWQQAGAYFQQAADQDVAGAMVNLAMMYENGVGVMADPQKALGYWQQAAGRGSPIAEENLARIYRTGADGASQDMTKAANLYQQAADQGDAQAMSGLAWMYANGEGVQKDTSKAIALTQEATLTGYSPVRAALTLLYTGGPGAIPPPIDPALVGTWQAGSGAQSMRWVISQDGEYQLSGMFGDAGVAGGSQGLLVMSSTTGNERAEVTYELHGDTLDTYSPEGPAEWHLQKVNSDETAGDETTKKRSSEGEDQPSSDQPSSGGKWQQYLQNYGGYGGGFRP